LRIFAAKLSIQAFYLENFPKIVAIQDVVEFNRFDSGNYGAAINLSSLIAL
jgi:hypothetical protein